LIPASGHIQRGQPVIEPLGPSLKPDQHRADEPLPAMPKVQAYDLPVDER
jgi:hypothetical protein